MSNYDSEPINHNINYEKFLFYLKQGREIEFIYKDKEYFLSNSKEGRALWCGQTMLSEYFNAEDLNKLNHIKIDNYSIIELFQNFENEIKIQTIF